MNKLKKPLVLLTMLAVIMLAWIRTGAAKAEDEEEIDFITMPDGGEAEMGDPFTIQWKLSAEGCKVDLYSWSYSYRTNEFRYGWYLVERMAAEATSYTLYAPKRDEVTRVTYRLNVTTPGGEVFYSEPFEIVWGPVRFLKQPVGGVCGPDEEFTISYEINREMHAIYLYEYEDWCDEWFTVGHVYNGPTANSYTFRQSESVGQTHRYKLSVFGGAGQDMAGGNEYIEVESEEFEITWEPFYITEQPKGGIAERGEPFTVSWGYETEPVWQDLNRAVGHAGYQGWETEQFPAKDVTSTAISYGTPGTKMYYRITARTDRYKDYIYSEVFGIYWSDYFKTQPVDGVAKAGEPYTIHFEHCVADNKVLLYRYNSEDGHLELVATIGPEATSYDIPYGTAGKTDRFVLYIQNGCGVGKPARGDDFKITWGDIFEKQPAGGACAPGEDFKIDFAIKDHASSAALSLEQYTIKRQWRAAGELTAPYAISAPATELTNKYRIKCTYNDFVFYSKSFEVNWVTDAFTVQPVGGISEPGKPFVITFDHYLKDYPILLGTGVGYDHLSYLTVIEPGATTAEIPLVDGKPGTKQYYALAVFGGGGSGVNIYSEPFAITWSDYFKVQPVGGISEVGKAYPITFANCVSDADIYLKRYDKATGEWQTEKLGRGITSYDIPYGTKGETDRFMLWVQSVTEEGVYSNEFEVTWREEGAIPRIPRAGLLSAPEPVVAGSRLWVNEAVLESDDEFYVGYLYGYVTWVYTSVTGEVSTYRFTSDSEFFTVTKDMYHGKVHCEVYNESESAVWVSPDITFDDVHNFLDDGKCSVCGAYRDAIGARLAGYSLSLSDSIGVNFYMELAASVLADTNAKFVMQLPDGSKKEVAVSKANQAVVDGKTYYVFDCHVAAKEMTDVICAQIVLGDGTEGSLYEFTVQEYARYILEHPSMYESAVPVVKAMLNYGASAQKYFDYQTDSLADSILMEVDKKVSETPELSAYDFESPAAVLGTAHAGTSLILESEVGIKCYFDTPMGFALSSISVRCNGVSVSTSRIRFGEENGLHYILITGITPAEYGAKFRIKAHNLILEDVSVYGYMYKAFAGMGTSEDLAELMIRLYEYGQASAGYER